GILEPACDSRNVERVADRDVLKPRERSILDPARRVDRRVRDSGAVIQRLAKEVLGLQRVALGRIYQRGFVQHLLPMLRVNQEAHVELADVGVAAKAEAE